MSGNNKFTDLLNISALGDKLREAREEKNITLAQAQKHTKIHSTVLKAIEDGKCDSILNPTYVKSFLKKYADYLGVDSHQVLSEYKRLCPDAEPSTINRSSKVRENSKHPSSVLPFLKLIAVGIIAIALIVFIGGKAVSYLKKQGPAKRVSATKADRQTVSRMKSAKKVSREAAALKKEPEAVIPKNVQIKLLLKVNRNVFVKMKTDGVLLFERVLTKGTAEMFTADKSINISVANGEAIDLFLNGKPLGSPGKGVLRNIEITRTGVKLK